jgi:hypothetical protein
MRINIDGKWQFYKTYHDKDYIQSHDTSKYRVPDLLSSQEKKLNMMLKTKYGKGSILKQTRKLEDTI